MKNKTHVVLYQNNNLSQDLNVHIENDTVWLTQKQIADLFGTKIPAISKHIRNIFLSKELKQSATVSKMEIVQQEGSRTVVRDFIFYNLDMILSIGYRVNSIQATQFRIWANQILKDYLLNGYALNARVGAIEQRVAKLEVENHEINKVIQQALPPKQGIFYEGQIFDAYAFVSDLIKSAKKSIILIDNYVDESVLLLLSKRNKNVSAKILTANFNQILKQDLSKHNAQYSPIKIEKFTKSHDRFLIIDDTQVYHIGASLKDLGKKWFAFSKMKQSPLQ
ncbi:MAG: virulence RhuM family protein [Bacteroidales bacterium]|nr:virulence RhuM family protein [Bacteroidales bacterium]